MPDPPDTTETVVPDPEGSGELRVRVRPAARERVSPRVQLLILAGSVAVLVAARLLDLHPAGVSLPWIAEGGLPEICWLKRTADVRCAGCGLTRSFVSLAHGRWATSLAFHPFGPVLLAMVAAQVPFRLGLLWRGRPLPDAWNRWMWRGVGLVVAGMVGRWLFLVLPVDLL